MKAGRSYGLSPVNVVALILKDLVRLYLQESMDKAKSALQDLQAPGRGVTPAHPGGGGAAAHGGYNYTRLHRPRVPVPMETCALAQQTQSKRDIQVGTVLYCVSTIPPHF